MPKLKWREVGIGNDVWMPGWMAEVGCLQLWVSRKLHTIYVATADTEFDECECPHCGETVYGDTARNAVVMHNLVSESRDVPFADVVDALERCEDLARAYVHNQLGELL